jgi:hypothetical protein
VEKRLIKRYRTLLLLPVETCDEAERKARLANVYQQSILRGWQSIAQTREKIAGLETSQRKLVFCP